MLFATLQPTAAASGSPLPEAAPRLLLAAQLLAAVTQGLLEELGSRGAGSGASAGGSTAAV